MDAYKESAYSYSDYNVQGDTLILYISKEKYDDLLENVKQELEDEKEILTDKKPTYHLEYGEEYGEVSYYIDSSIDAEWFQWRDIVIRQTCAGYRVLKGFENYHPVVKIFNCHTGKLVGEQDETGAININANDW